MDTPVYLSAPEAANELGIRQATLYAYVSRGLIRSVAGPGRSRRYHAEDVRLLRDRREGGEADGGGATPGGPVLESALTLIDEAGPIYRGHAAVALAETASLERIATLLWDCATDPFARPAPELPLVPPAGLRPLERVMTVLAAWPMVDPSAYGVSRPVLEQKGAALVRVGAAALLNRAPSTEPVHLQLAGGWGVAPGPGAELIRAALVLSADHEFNTSAFAVRCAASTRAPLHAALGAGLGAFSGARHGASSERVEGWLERIESEADIDSLMQERLYRGEDLPGFGHSIYTVPDPRAAVLLRKIADAGLEHPLVPLLPKLTDTATRLFGQAPNIDFALAALRRVLGLPEYSGMSMFCAGRLVGWIAHALEQYQRPEQIRPRARYVGERPR